MAIEVTHGPIGQGDGEIDVFSEGTNWVIDDSGRLHIVGQAGNLASYNSGGWANVYRK